MTTVSNADALELQNDVVEAIDETGEYVTFDVATETPNHATMEVATSGSSTPRVKVSPFVFSMIGWHGSTEPLADGNALIVVPARDLTFTPTVGQTLTRELDGAEWGIAKIRGEHTMQATRVAWELELEGYGVPSA